MKVIFLDIDGVINNHATFIWARQLNKKYVGYSHRHYDEVDPRLLALVRHIVETVDAKIVISSSWRILHTNEQILDVFKHNDWPNAPIIGATGRSNNGFRGQEVQDWITQNPVSRYAILDDDGDFFEHQPLFKTNGEVGLTWDTTKNVIEFLKD